MYYSEFNPPSPRCSKCGGTNIDIYRSKCADCSPAVYGRCAICEEILTIDHICSIKESNKMNTKICGTCQWYMFQLCNLNPQTVKKASMNTCSHWTPKTVNEDSTAKSPTNHKSCFVNENY